MNKRELKRALKSYSIREVWMSRESIERFEVLNDLRTVRQKERVEEVILEIMKEWN